MAEPVASARRVIVEDARRNGHALRVTWHPDSGQFVVSNWRGSVCVASCRIAPEDAAGLIGVLANGLGEASAAAGSAPDDQGPSRQGNPASLAEWAHNTWTGLCRLLSQRRKTNSPTEARVIDLRSQAADWERNDPRWLRG